jgi:hypothetical protein
MINWNKYFDRIYCIHYLPQKNKLARLFKELDRVGLSSNYIFNMRYTCPSPYDKIIFEKYRDRTLCPSLGFVNICLEVRRILYEALEFGYKRILLLEDDLAFLKDKNDMVRILDAIPNGYDIIQFDKLVTNNGWMKQAWDLRNEHCVINDYFIDASGTCFTSAGCIGLSRHGIEGMLKKMDEVICATDVAPLLMKNFKYAVAKKNLAIQVLYAGSNTEQSIPINYMHDGYMNSGIDYSEYNVPNGYGYGKAYEG